MRSLTEGIAIVRRVAYLLAVLTVSLAPAAADDAWQLTLRGSAPAIELISASPIARAKRIVPRERGERYLAEWLGRRGNLIGRRGVTIPAGVRGPASEGHGCVELRRHGDIASLRIRGPRSGRVPRAVRLIPLGSRDGSILKLPRAPQRDGIAVKAALVEEGPIAASKIRDTGPDANRHVIAIMGDGYTAAEISSGKFAGDVQRIVSQLSQRQPWDKLYGLTNIYRIDAVSRQTGVDIPSQGLFRDTYFNSSFEIGGIARLLAPDSMGIERAIRAADGLVGAGVWDSVVLVVNSERYGGSGGFPAVTALSDAAGTLAHELGHTIFGLADEYGGHAGEAPPESPEPNVDHILPPKWRAWIAGSTELPTPDQPVNAALVGAFEGGRLYDSGIYRPARSCLMRSLPESFCPVCGEAMLTRYMSDLALVDSRSPNPLAPVVLDGAPARFEIAPAPMQALEVSWEYCGTALSGVSGWSVSLSGGDGSDSSCRMSARIRYAGPDVRQHEIEKVYSWTVRGCAKMDVCGVCGGDGSSCGRPAEPSPPLRISLRRTPSKRGCALEARAWRGDGPSAGLRLGLQSKRPRGFRAALAARTNEAGVARFEGLSKGFYRATAAGGISRTVKCR